jgi:hypothetical protein
VRHAAHHGDQHTRPSSPSVSVWVPALIDGHRQISRGRRGGGGRAAATPRARSDATRDTAGTESGVVPLASRQRHCAAPRRLVRLAMECDNARRSARPSAPVLAQATRNGRDKDRNSGFSNHCTLNPDRNTPACFNHTMAMSQRAPHRAATLPVDVSKRRTCVPVSPKRKFHL